MKLPKIIICLTIICLALSLLCIYHARQKIKVLQKNSLSEEYKIILGKDTSKAPLKLVDYLLKQKFSNRNTPIHHQDTIDVPMQDAIPELIHPIPFTRRYIIPIDSVGKIIGHPFNYIDCNVMDGKLYYMAGVVSVRD